MQAIQNAEIVRTVLQAEEARLKGLLEALALDDVDREAMIAQARQIEKALKKFVRMLSEW